MVKYKLLYCQPEPVEGVIIKEKEISLFKPPSTGSG